MEAPGSNAHDLAQRLMEFRERTMEELEALEQDLRQYGNRTLFARAQSYWIAHMYTALGGNNEFKTYSTTLVDTARELEESDVEDPDQE